MQGNKFVVMITDYYSKLSKTIRNLKLNAIAVAPTFFQNWVLNHGIFVLDINRQRPSVHVKRFVALYNTLRVNNITTTENHLQTNECVELF